MNRLYALIADVFIVGIVIQIVLLPLLFSPALNVGLMVMNMAVPGLFIYFFYVIIFLWGKHGGKDFLKFNSQSRLIINCCLLYNIQ